MTVDLIIANLMRNAATAQQIIAEAVGRMPAERTCECAHALKTAIITAPGLIPGQTRQKLDLLIGKYLD